MTAVGTYRFLLRPMWILFHLVVVAAIVTMIQLGFWQLRRLDERQDFNHIVIERSEQAPIPVSQLLADGAYDPETDEWLPVELTGSYLPEQLVEFNVSQGGRAGENVLAAMLLDDGATVIVNRGFIPLGFDIPPAPATEVTVQGLLRRSEQRTRGGLTDTLDPELREVRRVDIPQIAPLLAGDVAPFYVQLVVSDPPVTTGDPEPTARPDLDNGPHLSYAIQWFIFALCVAIGWGLAVRRSLATRRRAASATTDPSGEGLPARDAAVAAPDDGLPDVGVSPGGPGRTAPGSH